METMNAEQKAAYLKSELRNFCGTETWFRHPLFRKFLYTEGVQFLAEEAGAYWLSAKAIMRIDRVLLIDIFLTIFLAIPDRHISLNFQR